MTTASDKLSGQVPTNEYEKIGKSGVLEHVEGQCGDK